MTLFRVDEIKKIRSQGITFRMILPELRKEKKIIGGDKIVIRQ